MRELDESERLLQFKPGVAAANALLIDLVAGHWLTYPDGKARPTYAPAPCQLRRAEAFMHANAGRAISMGEVADQAGVSMRALQLAFRKYRQTTPHSFLLECRLHEARQRLCNPQPGDTVASIFQSVGASHLGRFAQLPLAVRRAPLRNAQPQPRSRVTGPGASFVRPFCTQHQKSRQPQRPRLHRGHAAMHPALPQRQSIACSLPKPREWL